MSLVTQYSTRSRVQMRQLPIRVDKDIRRVVILPFSIGSYGRIADLFERLSSLSDDDVSEALDAVKLYFSRRHRNIEARLEEHARHAIRNTGWEENLSEDRRQLLGAYFSMEYSVEAAALFNPSIVPHPNQDGVPDGNLRFIMSLRAVGEGHISSTVFQTGLLTSKGGIALDPPGRYSTRTRIKPDRNYMKSLFARKLEEMNSDMSTTWFILDRLPDEFTIDDLKEQLERARNESQEWPHFNATADTLMWLARANYMLQLGADEGIDDLILFPRIDGEDKGIEDMRLVQFAKGDGSKSYYGTFTSFDGRSILPMLMETNDFRTIEIHTLNGACVQNKGMSLFPRMIGGHYCMCSRNDGKNLYLMFSDYIHFWESAELLAEPKFPWELRLIGNCGSPIETEEGWILITHGVGPMRRYCIGAMLLDREDPFRIKGRLREPLIAPSEEDREGYVPNVVYSCGSIRHNGQLIMPYAVSDYQTRFASIDIESLIDQMLRDGP